uniref:Uncharacterized protein n=1 Tax=Panagrellus redivivus TaxID=6233 RepID=A0A7E4VQU3_PANRE
MGGVERLVPCLQRGLGTSDLFAPCSKTYRFRFNKTVVTTSTSDTNSLTKRVSLLPPHIDRALDSYWL